MSEISSRALGPGPRPTARRPGHGSCFTNFHLLSHICHFPKEALDQTTTAGLEFHGVKPNAQATVVPLAFGPGGTKRPRGANFQEASNRVHFYTWVNKRGTLYRGTNWAPWKKYRVLGKWLDDLWSDHKLDHKEYGDLPLQVRVGYSGRKRDLEQVLAHEREAVVDRKLEEVGGVQDQLKAPFRVFPAVEAWESTFLEVRFRWPLLVLVADSASGKSSFAESRFDHPYLLTVEDAEYLDLRDFDNTRHDGLVLDNVNSWAQLLKWRAVLQARNAKSRGGQSATNVYSYVQYLYGVPVVATIDLDAPDAYLADEDSPWRSNWLCKNTVCVRLPPGQAFYDTTAVPQTKVENRFSLFAQTLKRRRQH